MSGDKVDRGQHGVLASAAKTAAESVVPVDDIEAVDHSRRRLLTAATAGVGAVGSRFRGGAVHLLVAAERSRQGARRAGRGRCLQARGRPDAQGRMARSAGLRGAAEQGGHRCARGAQRSAGGSEFRRLAAAAVHQGRRSCAGAKPGVLGGIGGVHPSRLLAARVRSSRTTRFRSRARISGRTGRAASIARVTARSTTSQAGSSRACRHPRT